MVTSLYIVILILKWGFFCVVDAVCIAETGLVSCRCLGAQRQVTTKLAEKCNELCKNA